MAKKKTDSIFNQEIDQEFSTLDRFVKIIDASRILGFSSVISVHQMIDRKELHSYSLPGTSTTRVLLSDILSLKRKKQETESTQDFPKEQIKKSRGRPRKY